MPSEAFLRRLRERVQSKALRTAPRDLADGPVLEQRQDWVAVRIYSRLLDAEIWLARNDRTAAELIADGTELPVLLLDEIPRLANKPPELLRSVLRTKRAFPGARWVQ